MDYHVARNNQKLGVFAGADAQARYQSGEILPTDLVWCEGMPAWRAAVEVFVGASPAAVPLPAIPPIAPGPSSPGPFSATPPPPKPANCLVWAILVTVSALFCCVPLPFGIVAIIFASQVDPKYNAGDYAGAQLSSSRAKLWCWLGFGLGALLFVGYVAFIVVFGAAGFLSNLPH